MATLEICNFLIYFLFFLFHPHSASTTCGGSTCSDGGPLVRFPFQLTNHQAKTNCGYPGYDLSCNNRSQTTLTLPSFGDFTVQTINYMIQVVSISDPDNCLPKRFLHHETNLVENSPFLHRTFSSLVNYTFFNCSSSEVGSMPSRIISCLSTEYFKVIALHTSWLLPPYPIPLPLCSVISTTLAPSLFDWDNHDIELTWKVPDCRSCEERGQVCELKKGKRLQIRCFVGVSSDPSKSRKNGIRMGVGIPELLLSIWLGLHCCGRMTEVSGRNQPIVELSTVTNRQPRAITIGLDGPTIESYPKTQLGEKLELPKPNDNTCPICLCEYQSMETLRTIPDCEHYFHANCIDEWLKLNATCPLCRNPQER
ncbi:hypothetical protein C1H46_012581 [Malus baccata]|uniref:RING-type E3 ubiquitin transferase n=1 Tax=Malus baccata TaxID=106549 RepID=A0A540MSP8_MALBA|nr:hypothetical protein C1H46_012581 [Malus baccata]